MKFSILKISLSFWFAALSLASTEVDLGYSIYHGVENSTTKLTTFKGPLSLGPFGSGAPIFGDEDCLFLSVYTPSTDACLPVLVYIHGGGYGAGDGTQDMSSIINANQNSFVAVVIQYRLGAFGFLSGAEVHSKGVVNAGLLDQNFALQWVQKYISRFGGDSTRVTISGESAGAGSVMLQNMAYEGTLGTSLFVNSITASPYLPAQYGYSDPVPTQLYIEFLAAAGCPTKPTGSSTQSNFECLIAQNTTTLQKASFNVSASGTYGTWQFVPVTDGNFVQQRPSQQLLQKKLNGKRQLAGNNAREGDIFVLPTIASQADLVTWINQTFPYLTASDKSQLMSLYPVTVSPIDTAYSIYGESVFVCPSYWLAEAYSAKDSLKSYKYQYSVVVALHSTDVAAYFGPPEPNQGPDFVKAFQSIWGNFITNNDPSVSSQIANGASSPLSRAKNPASDWPTYSRASPSMINLNQTGGVLANVSTLFGTFALEYVEPGLSNNITLVDAATWENGRGARCDFWRTISANVPE